MPTPSPPSHFEGLSSLLSCGGPEIRPWQELCFQFFVVLPGIDEQVWQLGRGSTGRLSDDAAKSCAKCLVCLARPLALRLTSLESGAEVS